MSEGTRGGKSLFPLPSVVGRLTCGGMRVTIVGMDRRTFLKQATVAMPAAAAGQSARNVWIVSEPEDRIASTPPAKWAADQLRQALAAKGLNVRQAPKVQDAPAGDHCVVIPRPDTRAFQALLRTSDPESLSLSAGSIAGHPVTHAAGSDERGLVYALLELADRAAHSADSLAAIEKLKAGPESPANRIRSMARCFESDVEDKAWFYDKAMWREYLTMLAAQRFNRFSLTLGLGYNFPRHVSDVYFYFAYPFLVEAPGYKVRASGLADSERDRNLEMLKFISDETAARGLDFQLGLWTHAWQWVDSPRVNYVIEGLTRDTHAPYCRDALTAVLKACPAIRGVTFRIHGESGIPEGSYEFWKTLFDGIVRSGRKIEIDMHAKGMDQKTIDVALATGMPVNVSPKYWAEHMGLPYHQAEIRALERPPERKVEGTFTLSSGSRRFLRYGYGDLLKEGRRYGVLHRIWPGTQRVLLWGDPAMAAGYGRLASFCGSAGVEWQEPLSFKGRMGSGRPGGRCGYADASLNPKYDWEKFLYTYRVWGRSLYNPDTDPDGWRRQLRTDFGAAAAHAEPALANASRVLLLVTTAHGLSGSNNRYWPEMYTNMPIVDAGRKHPYTDTPEPRRFGTVSSFDPQLFFRIDDFADALLDGTRSGRYSPLQVAQWLEEFAGGAAKHLARFESQASNKRSPEFRRFATDVAIQSGLGRFFAWKLRAGVLWRLHDRTGDGAALEEALKAYRAARTAWAELADRGKGVYAADITYGREPYLRGHWLDRLPAIDEDIADMEKQRTPASSAEHAQAALRRALARPQAPPGGARHTAPAHFRPGEPLAIELSLEKGDGREVLLHYRHVNQAERWRSERMTPGDNRYRAEIASAYTNSPYPLQYYFELHQGDAAWLYPGFDTNLANLPYFVVRQAASA